MPRLLTGLSIANGCLTLITAITFAAGDYGAFRPQDSGAFRAIAGLIVAFAAIACVAFAAAAFRQSVVLVAGLAAVVAVANSVFLFAPFYAPRTLHTLTALTSALVLLVAATEMGGPGPARLKGWPVLLILLGSAIGSIALIGVGRYEFGPGDLDPRRAAGIAICVIGLTLFAVGTGAVAAGRRARRPLYLALVTGTASAGVAAIWTGIADLQRVGVGFGSFADVGNPWSNRFWLLLAATLLAATVLGGMLNSERHPS